MPKSREYALQALPAKPEQGAHYYVPNGDGSNVDHYIGTCDGFRKVGTNLAIGLIPQATETIVGAAELATVTEAITGTDHTRIITPYTLDQVLAAQPAAPPDSYTHDQSIPEAIWIITHNLGFNPNVSIVDSTGRQVHGSINYNNINQLTASFAAAFAGRAYLS